MWGWAVKAPSGDIYWKDEGDFAFVGGITEAGQEAIDGLMAAYGIAPEPGAPFGEPDGEPPFRYALGAGALAELRRHLPDGLTVWES